MRTFRCRCAETGSPCPACEYEAERRVDALAEAEPDTREHDGNVPRDLGAVLTRGGW